MIGRKVGNYRLIRRLGHGGMGVVFLAEHPQIARRAAIKFLRADLGRNRRQLKRFFNEARAAASIHHPGIVEVYDFGITADGTSYIAMEFVDGESLTARLGRVTTLPIPAALDIALQVADALGAVHAKQIIHRDLKPDNLVVTTDPREPDRELVKVLDFGSASLDHIPGAHLSTKAQTGSVLGTPVYMSPEQCRGLKNIDHRTDIYSLGVVLYEMMCGAPPLRAEGFGEMVYLQIDEPPPPPRARNPEISPELEAIVLRMLAKEPEQRQASMAEVSASLSAVAPPAPRLVVMTTTPPPRPVRSLVRTTFTGTASALGTGARSSAWPRVLAGGAALLAFGALAFWVGPPEKSTPTPPATPARMIAPPQAPPPVPPPEDTVPIEISTSPPGASILDEAGQLLDFTPWTARRTRQPAKARFHIKKDGFRPVEIAVPLDRAFRRHVALRRIAPLRVSGSR